MASGSGLRSAGTLLSQFYRLNVALLDKICGQTPYPEPLRKPDGPSGHRWLHQEDLITHLTIANNILKAHVGGHKVGS
ncbi:hypothetical protein PoB_005055800 [Plakobranchus ocellatus]|uniref:Uncharacterized protein n=1 Tax=Plakobranchus ocellatus TaxID=259542 RepID=A0AAV4BWN9_9GAST|nr:hypothetical protein PoB_005055800 [Plakobranchus ocellatus]